MTKKADPTWELDSSDGELTVQTGVTGRAARMGHCLTLLMATWQASVTWSAGGPAAARLVVHLDSLQVLRGEGGVTPLTGAEKGVARGNALKSLQAKKFPRIEFVADTITETDTGYLLVGPLTIHGVSRPCEIPLTVTERDGAWQLTCQAQVRQSDFGIKPFSMMVGTMRVEDVVTVSFDAHAAAPAGLP